MFNQARIAEVLPPNSPVKIILQCKILRHEHGLSIFLDHMKIIRRVDFSLKEYTVMGGGMLTAEVEPVAESVLTCLQHT
jgi:hypothetical protein